MANEPRNISTKTTAERLAGLLNTYFAKKTDLPTKVGQLTNDQNFQTKEQVDAAIAAKIGSVYKAAGTVTTPDFTKLAAEHEGNVYNVSAQFNTDSTHFVEGVDKKYPAGTNIVVVADGEGYKYDVLSGFVDLAGYVQKVASPSAGNFAGIDADGNVTDSGKKASDFVAAEEGKRLMTATEVEKLGGIADGATKVEVPATPDGSINVNGEKKQVYTLPETVLTDADIADYTEAELRTLLGLPAVE